MSPFAGIRAGRPDHRQIALFSDVIKPARFAAAGFFVSAHLRHRDPGQLAALGISRSGLTMRSIFATCLLAFVASGASAGELPGDGPVSAAGFGMGGADYYGDVRSHMPFTQEAPPRPIGMADVERVRAARRRAETAPRQVAQRRHRPHS